MKTRALDENRDWQFGRGLQSYTYEVEALQQNVATRIKQWKTDCFYSVAEGVDWNNLLDIGTKTLLDLDIKRVILQTGSVLKIIEYTSTLDPETRKLSVTCTLQTVYGEIGIEVIL